MEIEKENATRLTKQKFHAGRYYHFSPVGNYNFCSDCYKKFDRWIKKHDKINNFSDTNNSSIRDK